SARLGQVPGARAVDVAVRLMRDRPDRLGGAAEVEVRQGGGDQGGSVRDGGLQGGRVWGAGGRDWYAAGAVAADQRDDPVHQVAEAVGELVVGPADQAAFGEVGVGALGDIAQQPPADRVRAVLSDEVIGIDGGAT